MIREYSKYKPFRFWCQKVLPLVYDDSLSYYELLNKVVDYLNNVIKDVNALGTAFEELSTMVTDYFKNLDVQEEIDNKLDSMVEDGTLDAMIQPLVGDAVSDWLEDNVTPTGSAVLVDSTLTISGAAADAKKTGDEISDLKSELSKFAVSKNIVEFTLNATIANIEGSLTLYPNENNRVFVFPIVSGETYTVYKGYSMGGARIAYATEKPSINSVVTGYADFSTNQNYKEFIAPQNGYACVKIVDGSESVSIDTVMQTAFVYKGSYNSELTSSATDLRNVYTFNNTKASDIEDTVSIFHKSDLTEGFLRCVISSNGAIIASTNNTAISIIAKLTAGRKYTLNKGVKTVYARMGYTGNQYPKAGDTATGYRNLTDTNTQTVEFVSNYTGYAIIYIFLGDSSVVNQIADSAYIFEGADETTKKSTLYIDEKVSNINHVFYCGATRELNTLKAGIEKATQYMDATLYVDAGTYDLIQEFGQSWFDNLDGSQTLIGLKLKNRVHVVFSPNSKVVSHYTGTNEFAQKLYSPFNAGQYGFTMENLNLDCSRCRYAVHDERNSASEQFKSSYINCKMKIDNSANDYWPSKHCIGGGLGANAEVMIQNCMFESDESERRWGVYYHIPNVQSTTSYRSVLVIKDCYFITGTVSLDDVATTPTSTSDNSEYIITNNSFPQKYAGTDSQGVFNGLTKSYNVRDWNNNIRS